MNVFQFVFSFVNLFQLYVHLSVGENVQKISKSAKKEEEITKSRKDVFQFRSKEMKKTAAATNDDETVAFEYQETMKALRRPFPQQRKEPVI